MQDPTPSRRLRGAAILQDALVRELVEARLVCVLATSDTHGRIHAVPMWFAVRDDSLVLATGSDSRKAANLRRAPLATVVVHDSRPGCEVCGVCIRGSVELVAGESARSLVDQVHRRYVRAEAEALVPVAQFLGSDDVALILRPEEAFTWDERGSEASRVLREAGAALPLVPTEPRPAS
jgi:PPOX class probable F420-dependent enzyme